jgi:hypothetical protein
MRRTYLFISIPFLWTQGCIKKFDAPPPYTGPETTANFSIQALHAMHFNGNFEKITNDLVIEGIVIADDKTDNFYKSVVLQDSTGGITVRLDGFGLYNDFPVGRRVAVKLNGMWLGDYAGMLQLGSAVDRSDPLYPELVAVPVPLFDRFLVKKEYNNTVVPKTVRIDQLNDSLQSCLVKIDQLEFAVSDTGKSYADAINKQTENKTVKACGGGSIYLRTSGFADFAADKIPRGNGSVTAVYSVFRTEKQLLIRDTADVQMEGLRCTDVGVKTLFGEDFEQVLTDSDLVLKGWKNIAESGNIQFKTKEANGSRVVTVSAFATGRPAVISWLISPAVDLSNSANEILDFYTKDEFDNGGVLQVLVSTNYDGGNTPWKAKWAQLPANIAKGSVTSVRTDWAGSGNIKLNSYKGKIFIAFRYTGSDPQNQADKRTTGFQIDNVRMVGN